MSLINLESGKVSSNGMKAVLAICVVLFFYPGNISEFISNDLQISLFWSGVLLISLSIFPIIEWGCEVVIVLFFDRKLKKDSFTYRNTLKQPQWEQFLITIVGNVYLLLGLLLILLKIINQEEFFSEASLFPTEYTFIIILSFNLLFIFLVVGKTAYKIGRNKKALYFSQILLTMVKVNGEYPDKALDYYLSKSWFLFVNVYEKHYKLKKEEFKRYQENFERSAKTNMTNEAYFEERLRELRNLQNNIRLMKIDYLPSYKREITKILMEKGGKLEDQLRLAKWIYGSLLNSHKTNQINYIFEKNPNWGEKSSSLFMTFMQTLKVALMENSFKEKFTIDDINEDWITSNYTDCLEIVKHCKEITSMLDIKFFNLKKIFIK